MFDMFAEGLAAQAAELRSGALSLDEFLGRVWIRMLEGDWFYGLTVPVWRAEGAAQGLAPPPARRRLPRGYDPDRNFRDGPVAGTGRCRRGKGTYRHMRTRGELRDVGRLAADIEDLGTFPVQVKIRARRRNIPTLWDDIPACPS